MRDKATNVTPMYCTHNNNLLTMKFATSEYPHT